MLDFFIRRPIAVIMIFLGSSVLGLVALTRLPVSLLPPVPIPRIVVEVAFPQRSAQSLEAEVTDPLRRELLQVSGLQDIRSETRDEHLRLFLDFPFGADTDQAFIETNEKVDLAMESLPREMPRPRVWQVDLVDVPVFDLAVTLGDSLRETPTARQWSSLLELSEFARQVLRNRLEQLPGIALADLSGHFSPRIALLPRTEKLHALGMSVDHLAQSLQAASLELGSISLRDGNYQYQVRFPGALQSMEEIRAWPLYWQGRLFALRELAEVSYQPDSPVGMFLHDGRPGIVFSLRKQAD
ncbi:MAG: efflux RND transporter permease subunit, partial [Lewinella sp.]|nr:efflux RND transporter permease subunit [Lewinella sp.]